MKKFFISFFVVIVLLVSGGLYFGVDYLYNYAIIPGEKDFLSKSDSSGSSGGEFEKWEFTKSSPLSVSMKSRDGLRLRGTQFKQKQEKKPKLAILAHGYGSDSEHMKEYAELFYNLGYDLLLPDARGHGKSEGDYIGFGWHDRLDYVDWTDKMVQSYQGNVDILLFGVSMGGATVMMASGEKLPNNVKVIVEDCGYDTVENELKYQLKEMFNLPAFPIIPLASAYTNMKVNYSFYEASSVEQLKKNTLPMLFIHGTKDKFVPTDMIYSCYEASKGPKKMILIEEAEHAESHKVAPRQYKEEIVKFIKDYI